jgi:hypothetical protein
MKNKIIIIPILLLFILSLGCASEGGKWIYATTISKSIQPGGMNLPDYVTQFKDSSGNVYISKETQDPIVHKAVSIYSGTQINKTYLIHIDSSGYVDDIALNQ